MTTNNQIALSAETINTLKSLYDIDQSLIIDHEQVEDGVTVLRSKTMNGTMAAKMFVEEQFPRNVNIYDLREFISVVSLINKPTLDFSNDNYIIMESEDKTQKLRYFEANPDLIDSHFSKDIGLSDDVELSVGADQFKSVLTAAQTMRFEYIGFVADESGIVMTAFNKNTGDEKETNLYTIKIQDNTEHEFKMLYKLEIQNVSVLSGEGDLTFVIDGGKKFSKVVTDTGKVFWATFDVSSNFVK